MVSSIAAEVTSNPPSLSDRNAQPRFPRLWISLTEFGRATTRQPMWPGSEEPPVRAGSIATGHLGLFWLFLQPNNSQCSNCQIRNTRISTESVTLCSESWGSATSVLPKPSLSPVPPVLSGHIRLGSPPSSPTVFAICTQITAIQLARSPSAAHRRFPEAP
jgi:hypothetical protein